MALLCLGLWLGIGARAAASEGEVPVYEDGEVVGFIGDSITHVTYADHGYVELVEQYYLSRFPERQIEFRSIGAGGYKAGDILNIYDLDPAFRGLDRAVIMLGTNEAILGLPKEEYMDNMARLVERLKQDGLAEEDILILSPPICDETWAVGYAWNFEDRVLEYMEELEARAQEWGVGYLDFHTSMARVTEEIQKVDPYNSLTRDSIHPNAMGHRLIAFYFLQAQGFGGEALSDIRIPENGEPYCSGDEITDLYRGEKGIYGMLHLRTLPPADEDELSEFRAFSEEADILYGKRLQAEGLATETFYQIFMGDALLGEFTGEALAQGIDLTVLEGCPGRETMGRIAELGRERHQKCADHRSMWIEVMMQRASYTPEQAQAAYDSWRAEDERLRSEMYALAKDAAGDVLELAVVEKGYSATELRQESAQAREHAQEQAMRKWQELSLQLQERAAKTAEGLGNGMALFTRRMENFPF